jgi:hypothetical protein
MRLQCTISLWKILVIGYPYSATYQWAIAPNWIYLKPQQPLFGHRATPDCAMSAGASNRSVTTRIVSISALP